MKNLVYILFAIFTFSACTNDTCIETYYRYDPVYLSEAELDAFQFEGERSISNPGKIYTYGNLLLINEVKKGIHFIDNSDQSNPEFIGFLALAGNVDMAVKNDILYADGYRNMMAFDISTPSNPVLKNSIADAFNTDLYYDVTQNKYRVDFIATEITETFDCDEFRTVEVTDLVSNNGGFSSDPNLNSGQAGSFARFALDGDYLYAVNSHQIRTYDVSSPSALQNIGEHNLDWGIETIFPYKEHLFIGANNGLYIFEKSDPTAPQFVSQFTHATACDPVVVQNDIAYVTLRSGTDCQGFTNQLDVINVADVTNPQLLSTHPMSNPHGLSVRNDELFICDGDSGIKVFNKSDHSLISERLLAQISGNFAYDIILLNNNTAIVLGKADFYQYDISNINNIKLLSTIKFQPS